MDLSHGSPALDIPAEDNETQAEESSSLVQNRSPTEEKRDSVKMVEPSDEDIDLEAMAQPKKLACGEDCPCRNQLEVTRRVKNLPPVKALVSFYESLKTCNPLFNCVLTSAEVAALIAAVPARVVTSSVQTTLSVPIHVADLVMCRVLDVAERALPCLNQPPTKSVTNFALCVCGAPIASCYLCSKLTLKAARACLCDVPAVACGAPAVACLSAAEVCVCDVPRAVCCLPAAVAVAALRVGLADVQDFFKDVDNATRVYNSL